MNTEEHVELLLAWVLQLSAPMREARIVDNDVDASEPVDGGLNGPSAAVERRNIAAVRHSPTTCLRDGRDHFSRRHRIRPFAVELGSEIVDHDRSTSGRQRKRVGPPETAAGSRDQSHPSVDPRGQTYSPISAKRRSPEPCAN